MAFIGGIITIIVIIILIIIILLSIFNSFSTQPTIPSEIPTPSKGKVGHSCVSNTNCEIGLICENGLCKVVAGGDCNLNTNCTSAQKCVLGKCKTPLPFNSVCTNSQECLSNICDGGICKRNLFEVCSVSECATSLLCDDVLIGPFPLKPVVCRRELLSICSIDDECYSGKCTGGICDAGVGESCSVAVCNTHFPTTCDVDNICKGGFAFPCTQNIHCLSNNCISNVCFP